VDFSNLFITLSGDTFKTLQKAQEAGSVTINYGVFLNNVVEFTIIAFALFLIIKQINKMNQPAPKPSEPTTKTCHYCMSEIPIKATRCPQCTSDLT
jgi:large conductance mechanosensitive channel